MKKSIWNSEDRNEFPNYNRMMQSIRFYKMFLKYEYMLLCQPDALILQGKKELKEITIKKEVVDPEDVEMLQDLILTCVNEALRKVDSAQAAQMGKYNIPGLM